jgi:hypothetical protein
MSSNLKNLCFAPDKPSALSSLRKLALASPRGTKRADIQTCLLKQNSYNLQRPVRKKFTRNPYNNTYIFDFWKCDFMDIQKSVNIMMHLEINCL